MASLRSIHHKFGTGFPDDCIIGCIIIGEDMFAPYVPQDWCIVSTWFKVPSSCCLLSPVVNKGYQSVIGWWVWDDELFLKCNIEPLVMCQYVICTKCYLLCKAHLPSNLASIPQVSSVSSSSHYAGFVPGNLLFLSTSNYQWIWIIAPLVWWLNWANHEAGCVPSCLLAWVPIQSLLWSERTGWLGVCDDVVQDRRVFSV